ncbi:FAD-dependent monooxygenase [Mycolicibacterium vaccae]|uniref:Monooxygenase FAD-binding protein n=1 Tax=Mycolicibacterium vaccae ATCC 25954 TaxID=1194972 RepID=K0UMP4_MYCVA|nr:FAD-dependent monooxygenase [Mycolicibacterium vaccae]ANI40173.1 2-polyprenyl-6-methoxyphenol hydroxylase [Mycolicibacterium vaccae 95051]EJZ06305.1 monooxygenase FAD-binding protein [Mycolicibacterium vaccae ATCC 25954]MCV7063305.1 FAD-dependent monooxygenase [Mycolicibacterium vaccae]
MDVLIVGAGPTGLTAALELSRLGVPVRIVDLAEDPSQESRALAVQARTLELMRVRGVGEQMLALGNRADRAALHAGGATLATIELHRMPSRFNFILMLAQSETERLLTEQLVRQGVKVERGVEVTDVRESADAVEATLNCAGAQEVVRVRYVIAADGPHSTLRRAAGLRFPGRTLPHNYVLADLHIDGDLAEDQVSIFLGRNGFVATFPMGGGRFRMMATDPDGLTGDRGEPATEDLRRLFERVVHIPVRLHSQNWSSRFRINSRHVRRLRAGRVFFGGDAAHVHSPAGGQGMNLGIQDMVNLSWKLAMVLDGRAKPVLLETYSDERLPVARRLVWITEIGTRVFNSTNPVVHALRVRMAPRALARARVQDAAAAMFGQLSARYRGMAAGGRAGQRVPDVDGLYDQLDLAAMTLFTDDGSVLATARRWSEVVTTRGGRSADGWMLVRPDGYLAASGADAGALERFLRHWFVGGDAPGNR